jgi:hypothetical protein
MLHRFGDRPLNIIAMDSTGIADDVKDESSGLRGCVRPFGMTTRNGSVRFTLLVIGGFSKCGLFFASEMGSRNGRLFFAKWLFLFVGFGSR